MKAKTVIGILLVFVLGGLAGSLATGYFYQDRFERTRNLPAQPEARKKMLMDRLSRELELSAAQQEEIGIVLEQVHRQVRELREKHRPEMEELRNKKRTLIREKLSPDQQAKLDQMLERLEERGRHRRMSR